MDLKDFRKEFSGAPYGVKEFAETVLSQLDEPKGKGKVALEVHRLRSAALSLIEAEEDFALLLQRLKIDIG